jgi:hypothetical protein
MNFTKGQDVRICGGEEEFIGRTARIVECYGEVLSTDSAVTHMFRVLILPEEEFLDLTNEEIEWLR